MAQYKTHQKDALLAYMSANGETPLSAEEIWNGLSETSDAPGKSTVYRFINRLVEEGKLKRFERGNSRTFVYQLAADAACRTHLHMKCTGCGKLLHMDRAQSEKILGEILDDSDFAVSREDTTLFGTCRDCLEKTGAAEKKEG